MSGTDARSLVAAESQKKKTSATVKAATKTPHPSTSEMVNAAIENLKEQGGSSLQAINKYITTTYDVDIEKLSNYIKKYLKTAVASGVLVQTKGKGASGSFKLAKNYVAVAKHTKARAKNAASKLKDATKTQLADKAKPKEATKTKLADKPKVAAKTKFADKPKPKKTARRSTAKKTKMWVTAEEMKNSVAGKKAAARRIKAALYRSAVNPVAAKTSAREKGSKTKKTIAKKSNPKKAAPKK